MRIFLSSAILKSRLQKILIQWPMGHSGDDVNHKKLQKMKNVLIKLAENFGTGGKSILQVPDTGTRVLDNTRPFLHSSIVSF